MRENGGVSETVAATASAARAAAPSLVTASDDQINHALEQMASRLGAAAGTILEANRRDVADASGQLSAGLVDRLRLDEVRLERVASQVRAMAQMPGLDRSVRHWRSPEGLDVEERRVPVGVIGAVYEARPNVTADVATQLLKSRNAGVLRTGQASQRTAAAMTDAVIGPALSTAGLEPAAIALVRAEGHDAAEALVSRPALVPLVSLRGSGETIRHLAAVAARHGTRTLQHADGGGVLFVEAAANFQMAVELIWSSLDRLGVCNRLNWLLIERSVYASFLPLALDVLTSLGVAASMPPHEHPLSQEWALEPDRDGTVTVLPVEGIEGALVFADEHTSRLAATIVSDDAAAAERFVDGYRGTGVFWNLTTRLLDGYRLVGAPETGINVDHVPGPRGPVTYRDLYLRQYVVRRPT